MTVFDRLQILMYHHPNDLSVIVGKPLLINKDGREWIIKSAEQHCHWVADTLSEVVTKVEKAYKEIPEGEDPGAYGNHIDSRPAETEPSSAPLDLKPRGRDYSWKLVVVEAVSQLLFPCPDVQFWDKENMNCRVKITALPGWPKGMTIVMDMTREGGK